MHDSRHKTVQAVIVQKCVLQFRQHYRNRIFVLTVLRVVGHIALGAVQTEQGFHIILVGVGLHPIERDFLHGRTIVQLGALEDGQRVRPFEISHIGIGDTVHQNVHELVQIGVVARLEERAPGRLQAVHGGVGDALLEIVPGLQPDFLSEHGIGQCHVLYLL